MKKAKETAGVIDSVDSIGSIDAADNTAKILDTADTAIYSLWFGLNYGSILTAFALYRTLEELGKKPVLLPKPAKLWTDHYAEKDNIAGLFIYENCNVLEYGKQAIEFLNSPDTVHVAGSDIVWNRDVIGKLTDYFMLGGAADNQRKISIGSSFGSKFSLNTGLDSECYYLLHRFENNLFVADQHNADMLKKHFNFNARPILDPVFLCDKQSFVDCAERSAAKLNEPMQSFTFASIEGGDKRKKAFLLKGYEILLQKSGSVLRCMIDINRFPESKKALGIEPAYFIRVEDYLHYLINSEFVLTDNVYAMYMALVFEKPFAVMVNKDDPDIYRFVEFLSLLGLEERMVILQDDLQTKEYLFRKPVDYEKVNIILNEMKTENLGWLKNALGIEEAANTEEEEMSVGKEDQF